MQTKTPRFKPVMNTCNVLIEGFIQCWRACRSVIQFIHLGIGSGSRFKVTQQSARTNRLVLESLTSLLPFLDSE